jgi:hypothetical protein
MLSPSAIRLKPCELVIDAEMLFILARTSSASPMNASASAGIDPKVDGAHKHERCSWLVVLLAATYLA